MPCSTKMGVGLPAIVSFVLALPVIIVGIVIMTSSLPESRCGTSATVTKTDKDNADRFLMIITWPFLVGGILALIGGGIGAHGGCTVNKSSICCSSVTLGISAGFAFIGAMAAMFFAGVFSRVCDDYECGKVCSRAYSSSYARAMCNKPDVCCDSLCVKTTCKPSHDWFCDMGTKKTMGMLIGIIGIIVFTTASCCGCAACCCCPDSFAESAKLKGGQAAPTVQGVTTQVVPASQPVGVVVAVGQPVGNEK